MAKTIMVTGTSSGIGRATVERFARAGWDVVATVRRPEQAAIYAGRPNVRVVVLDLSQPAQIEPAARAALAAFGRVDLLVNNAGYFQMGPLEASSMGQIRAQFETNVFGLIALTKAFLRPMREQGGGVIVNVASLSAENGYPFASVYSASKAAVAVLTEALNIELDELGIRVKAILPGQHATRIFTKVDLASGVPAAYHPLLRRFAEQQAALKGSRPEGVAEVIWRAVHDGRSDRVRYFAGPDARLIPTAKRLMGADGYFAYFKNAILRGVPAWLRWLVPQGDTPIEADLRLV